MISALVRELQNWIAGHNGRVPSKMRVPQAIIDDLAEESKQFGFIKDKKYEGKGLCICGISVVGDPTMTIGKIDS